MIPIDLNFHPQKCLEIFDKNSAETRLKKVRDREHMTFFGISSKNFYAYF